MSENDYILANFSPEKAQQIEIYQEIISIFSTSSERTIDSTYSLLESLNIFNNDNFLQFIIRKLIVFCEIFPFHIELYVNLAQKINLKMPNFKESFLTNSFHRYYYFIDCSESNFILYMFYKCIQNEIFTFQELITKFKAIFRQKYNYDENNILFFIYFSPEIKETDPLFYEEMHDYAINATENPAIQSRELTIYFLNTYQKVLLSNNFQLLRQYRDDGHLSENPLFEIIYHDDVDKLRSFLSNPNKSGNEIIYHSIISPYREVANKLSLISTAAVFSAVNCFKYLLLNGSRTDDVSKEMGSLAQDTIVGGNIEIIRFAQENRIDFDGVLATCANYFRNEIFEWIFEINGRNKDELTKQSPTGSTVFCQASRIGNIEIVLKCIELGIDLNSKDIDSTPISQAALGGCDEIVDILLEFGSQQAEAKKQNQKSSTKEIELNKNDIIKEINQNKNGKNERNGKNSKTKDDSESEEEEEEEEEDEAEDSGNGGDDDADADDISDSDTEYEYDYDNFDFEDSEFSVFRRVNHRLGIEQSISISSVIHSMREAAAEGQRDCIDLFVRRGYVVDISLIIRAITYSRFTTLEYLFQKVEFNVSPKSAENIEMTVHSVRYSKKEKKSSTDSNQDNKTITEQPISDSNENSKENLCLVKKDFKFVYKKITLMLYLFRFLMKQNDVRVVELVFHKLNFNINKLHPALLILRDDFMTFKMVDTAGFMIANIPKSMRITVLQNIPEKQLINLLKTSIFKKEIIDFCIEYSTENDIRSLPSESQKILEIVNSINK